MPHVPAPPSVSRWSRFLGAGAAASVVVLLGAAALAPYSISTAFAADGGETPAQREQRLDAAQASATVLDTRLDAVDTAAGAAASGKPGGTGGARSAALYTLEQFMFTGAVNWGGYKFTFYSQQVLPGPGLEIPGRHVNADGYVSDGDGYIVLAGSHPKGTVFDTPFGYQGKIYDRGTVGNHLDVYVR